MLCPVCKVEMAISNSRYKAENDTSADVETKLFMVHELKCRNPQCSNYGKVVETRKNPIQLSKE